MSNYLLTQILNYGAPLFGLILFIGAAGIPVPTSILVIAAGAFSQQGILDPASTALLGLIGAVLGDSLSFGMGYYARDWANQRIEGSPAWQKAQDAFASRAGMAVYLTRFLLTTLAIPTNLIAGGSGFRFRTFLTYDIAGETTWLLLYGGFGYWFGNEWELVSSFLGNFGGFMLGIVILIGGIALAIRRTKSGSVPVEHLQQSPGQRNE